MHFSRVFLLSAIGLFFFVNKISAADDIWAILIAGYDIYQFTYGFEGAVYKMHKRLIDQGVNKDHIIMISPDSAAFHTRNINPGAVTYAWSNNEGLENMPNYYDNVNIDYNSREIDSKLFYEILNGNGTALKGIGSEKVLKSGPKDKVFMYFITIGMHGLVTLNNNAYLYAEQFVPFLEDMKDQKRFDKMYIILDSFYAGSLFDGYLDPTKNILVQTFGGRYNELFLCHYNRRLNAFTSTCSSFLHSFSLEKAFSMNEKSASINDCFVYTNDQNFASVGLEANNLYGTMTLGREKLSTFLGSGGSKKAQLKTLAEGSSRSGANEEFTLNSINGGKSLTALLHEDSHLPEATKAHFSNVMEKIVSASTMNTEVLQEHTGNSIKNLPMNKRQCFEKSLHAIHSTCFPEKSEYFFLLQGHKVMELCLANVSEEKIQNAVKNICSDNHQSVFK